MSWLQETLRFFAGKKTGTNGVMGSSRATIFDTGYVPGKGPKTFDEAMAISTVFKCGRIIGETIGSFSCGYFRQDEDGNAMPYKEHKLYGLVNVEPHPLYTSFTYWETAAMHVAIDGNHYAYMNRDTNGEIESFDLLNPESMVVFTYQNRIWYRDQNTNTTYSQDDIIHVKGPSKDGLIGMTPISYAATTFNGAKAAGEYVDSVYANGAFIGGALMTDKELSNDQQTKLIESWQSAYGGSKKAGGTAVLEDGVQFKEIRMKPQDLDIILTKKYQDSDISGLYRVPLHLINALERSTNNNIEQQDIDFAKHCIRPYIKRIESEYNRKLVPSDKRGKEFIRFNMDSLLRGDTKSRGEFYKTMYYINAFTPNDILKLENQKTKPNGDETYLETMSKLKLDAKSVGENGTQNKKP